MTVPKDSSNLLNIGKMRSTFKQIVRDWSQEGKHERDLTYQPIIQEFKRYFPKNKIIKDGLSMLQSIQIKDYENIEKGDEKISVLFPGTGLGRIVYEFAKMGYGAQGNEFSYHMLLVSNYILNICQSQNQFKIIPYIYSFTNQFTDKQAFKEYFFPDEVPMQELDTTDLDFSMIAGDFISSYSKSPETFHSIVTCFFIDCANNIIEYVETIYTALKTNGVWINFGPLLYHFADQSESMSIELSWEELKLIINKIGFELIREEVITTSYATSEQLQMMQTKYNSVFFTAIKRKII